MRKKRYCIVKNALIKDQVIFLEGQVWLQEVSVHRAFPNEKKVRQFHRVRKHYAKTPLLSKKIQVEIGAMKYTVPLDQYGAFDTKLPYVHSPFALPAIHFHFKIDGATMPIEDLFPQTVWDFSDFRFGIVSDVDDTIVVSHASRMLKKLYHLLFKNFHKRKTVNPVLTFYNDLEKEGGKVFYVSNSEYNLYFLYRDFLQKNGFPSGPLFLSPRLRRKHLFGVKHKGRARHKIHTISQIIKHFPEKQFFLIGDSGQKDSKTYFHIVERFAHAIAAIIIRDIGVKKRNKYVHKYQLLTKPYKIPFYHIHHEFELEDILDDLHGLINKHISRKKKFESGMKGKYHNKKI